MRLVQSCFIWAALFPLNHPVWWKSVRSLVTALPSAILGILAWRMTSEHEKSPLAVLQQNAKAAIEDYLIGIVILLLLPTFLSILADFWEALAKHIERSIKDDLPAIVQTTLIRALDEIVAKKVNRFAMFLQGLMKSEKNPIDVFAQITQPKEQIEEILAQLYNALNLLLGTKTLKIVLVECKDNKPESFLAFRPSDAHPGQNLLSSQAFFFSVSQSESPIVIPDIKAHCAKLKRKTAPKSMPKFLEIGNGSFEGSIVGYPLKNTYVDEKLFVLSLKCSEVGIFNDEFVRKYRTIMDAFVKRILLEGCLLRIKNYTHHANASHDSPRE